MPDTLLIASTLAGLLWDTVGAPATFAVGAALSAMALAAILFRGGLAAPPR